jgi:hypothetical protein
MSTFDLSDAFELPVAPDLHDGDPRLASPHYGRLRRRAAESQIVEIVRPGRPLPVDDRLERLTPREREVLALMADGRTNGAIARAMVVTTKAVEKHVGSIFWKLGLPAGEDDHRRVLAVLRYLRGTPPAEALPTSAAGATPPPRS